MNQMKGLPFDSNLVDTPATRCESDAEESLFTGPEMDKSLSTKAVKIATNLKEKHVFRQFQNVPQMPRDHFRPFPDLWN